MTSNQIAYQANLETHRHQVAVEDETNRHNVEIEKLTQESNDIQKEKNVITATYEQQRTDIQKDYNSWFAKYSEATTKRKLDLEEEGNRIKQQLNSITEDYQRRMTDIHYMEVGNAKAVASETKRHNAAMEVQAMEIASMDWWFRGLEVKEKQRANDLTATYQEYTFENQKRGQDLTFAGSLISAMSKTGFDLAVPGFKIGLKGTMGTGVELFNDVIGGIYGKKVSEGPQESFNSKGGSTKPVVSTPRVDERRDEEGQGRAISGRLR